MSDDFTREEAEREDRILEVVEAGREFERPLNPKGMDRERIEALWTEVVICLETLGSFRPRPALVLFDYALGLYLHSATVTAEACLHLAVSGMSHAARPLERRLWESVIDIGNLLMLDSDRERTEGAAASLAWSFVEWDRHHTLAQETAAVRPTYKPPMPVETPEEACDRVCGALDRTGVPSQPVRTELIRLRSMRRPPAHWSGMTGRARVEALQGIEVTFPRCGPGFSRLALEVWAKLSSHSHTFPDWQIVDFRASFTDGLAVEGERRATKEYHEEHVVGVGDMLSSMRRLIHEARTGQPPRL